ncbi:MAG: hypothetical protein E7311_00490 [Clostridiales bacterium]|nr:hypothetical protein [Clostridiales bacterium]
MPYLNRGQKVDFKTNLQGWPDLDCEKQVIYEGNEYILCIMEAKNLGIEQKNVNVLITEKLFNETIGKSCNLNCEKLHKFYTDEVIRIIGEVVTNVFGDKYILAEKIIIEEEMQNMQEVLFTPDIIGNAINCSAVVKTTPRFSHEKDGLKFIKIYTVIPSLQDRDAKIYVSEEMLNAAIRQAFAYRLHLNVSIYVEGQYEIGNDGLFTIYANKLVLEEDLDAAAKYHPIAREEMDKFLKSKRPLICFTGKITGKDNDLGENELIFVKAIDKIFKKSEKIVLNIEELYYEKILKRLNIFLLHEDEYIFVEAGLMPVYNTIRDSYIEMEMFNFCILQDYTEDNKDNNNSVDKSDKLKYIVNSMEELSTKEKMSVIAKSLKQGEIKELMGYIKGLNIKENISSFVENVKEEFKK